MAELLKAYPKDVALVIEFPLKEVEALLDFLSRSEIAFDGDKEPEFKAKVDIAMKLIKSLDDMCESVRNYHGS